MLTCRHWPCYEAAKVHRASNGLLTQSLTSNRGTRCAHHVDADGFRATFQLQPAALQRAEVEGGCCIRCVADECLAGLGDLRQPGRDVDCIAQRCPVRNSFFRPHRADIGDAGMDADADRNPRPARIRVAGRSKQGLRRVDRKARMIQSDGRDVEGDDLIPHKLVDESIRANQNVVCHRVEPVHDLTELRGAHPLGQSRGAADVSKQEGELDLRTARVRARHDISGIAEGSVGTTELFRGLQTRLLALWTGGRYSTSYRSIRTRASVVNLGTLSPAVTKSLWPLLGSIVYSIATFELPSSFCKRTTRLGESHRTQGVTRT